LQDFILYIGVLSPEGYCRPFDSNGNGYSRSEAVAIVYLQKAKNAKRIYAICPHIKLNSDGYKEEGITYPSLLMQSSLLKECYNECGILTSCLDYIETHGTGTKVGDPQEVTAIYNSLCKNRKTPLMIGSVKSNLGHGEPASGFIQIAKVKQVWLPFLFITIKFAFILRLMIFQSHTRICIGTNKKDLFFYKNYSVSHNIDCVPLNAHIARGIISSLSFIEY